ncbi:MAG: sulfatase-like hydrolase/transferase [Bryobacterales bacterium]
MLIMADDVGYECFGFSGSKQYSTPQLDRIADSGVRFRNAFSTPLCTPSRVTIMTGKSNVRNYVDFGALAPGETTFAKLFHDAGYATAIAGKWQLQGSADAAGTPPAEAGFDTYCLWNTPLTKRPRYWTPSIEQDELLDLPADAYGPDVFSDFLIRFMERNRERPFFVYYPMALVPTHSCPLRTARTATARTSSATEDMVAYMDKIVGRVDATIDRLGLRENTVLIFTADNGTHKKIRSRLGDRVIKAARGRRPTVAPTCPCLCALRALGRAVACSTTSVDFADFLPTLAEVIGAAAPSRTDGASGRASRASRATRDSGCSPGTSHALRRTVR